jgi:hypothetical protein
MKNNFDANSLLIIIAMGFVWVFIMSIIFSDFF